MAPDTSRDVRSLVIYQVFPRNYGPNGGFADVTADLDRIKALGVDVVFLLPIHPIGVEGRKGSLGSPYAIRDYRAVNPELGTDADFDELIAAAHDAGLKVIIDVVFNHTAQDSVLITEHPEFYHRDGNGRPVTSVPQWSDIIDLDHGNSDLAPYLIESLAGWVRRGVDGFRCDVASLVPVPFWVRARSELAAIKPGLLWLAETVHAQMVEDRRARGLIAESDAQMFEAFDIEYTYDVWPIWQAVVTGRLPVARYLEALRLQDAIYPANYAKLRNVENHDNYRIMGIAPSRDRGIAWTALTAFLRGPFMIYAGQESGAITWPTLFESDPVQWGDRALSGTISTLARLKKHPAIRTGELRILADEPVVQLAWAALTGPVLGPVGDGPALYGLFNVGGNAGEARVQLPDGTYPDLLGGPDVVVTDGKVDVPGIGAIVEFQTAITEKRWETPGIDLFLHVEVLGEQEDLHG